MPGLAILSPIIESEELNSSSPYRARFGYVRYPGQRSPIGPKSPYYDTRDAGAGPSVPESMDDLWIYDCYVSEDVTSPGGYPRSPSTPSHNRSISLPVSTAKFVPPNNIPLIKEPTPHHSTPLNYSGSRDTIMELTEDLDIIDYGEADLGLPTIDTAVYTAMEFPEYSPLEQEILTMREVIDQLAAAVDQFSGLETVLSRASTVDPAPEMDEDTVFWFVEALNLFVSDCTEVALDLMQFSEFVEALLMGEQERSSLPVRMLPRASFSEQDMQGMLASAATIPEFEILEAMAELEAAVPPSPTGRRPARERPLSLRLSTSDAVLLQTNLQPRSRLQSVGAVGRFTERVTPKDKDSLSPSSRGRDETMKKHRAYVIYGDVEETPIEDNWSAKSVVEFSFGEEREQAQTEGVPRSRPISGQSAMPRPLSSPVAFGGKSFARARPPSLKLDSPRSPSSHSASSSVSSLFSGLPRSSFTTSSSTRSSPRQSITFDKNDKSRFPTSSVKFKKMFTNMFKNKDGNSRTPALPSSLRPFGRRAAGTGSIDATLSALHLSGMSTEAPLTSEHDPFAASPPPSASLPMQMPPDSMPETTVLSGYSSMFNGLKAASQYPSQPLFGGVGRELESP